MMNGTGQQTPGVAVIAGDDVPLLGYVGDFIKLSDGEFVRADRIVRVAMAGVAAGVMNPATGQQQMVPVPNKAVVFAVGAQPVQVDAAPIKVVRALMGTMVNPGVP